MNDVPNAKSPSAEWRVAVGGEETGAVFEPAKTGEQGIVFVCAHGAGGNMNDSSNPNLPFPTGCRTTELSAQEKALEFRLFDLSACIIPSIP